MKQLLLFLFFFSYIAQGAEIAHNMNNEYKQLSTSLAKTWFYTHIKELTKEDIITVLYTILLVHHLIQSSLDMTFHKLNLQEETLHLYSPSITDSLHAPIKMKQNNFNAIYESLRILEETQYKVQAVYQQIQKIGPCIISLEPNVTQKFINNIKTVLIAWSAQQKENINQFINNTENLLSIEQLASTVPKYFEEMITAKPLPHKSIRSFASAISKSYHKLESPFLSWLTLNKKRAQALKSIFTLSFKEHFIILYKKLSKNEKSLFLEQIDTLEIGLIDMVFIK